MQHGGMPQRLPVGPALSGAFLVPPGKGQPGAATASASSAARSVSPASSSRFSIRIAPSTWVSTCASSPNAVFTPHQVGKVLERSAGAVANALDKLTALGTAQMVTDKPRSYRLAPAAPAPAPDAAGDPGTSAEAAPSAA